MATPTLAKPAPAAPPASLLSVPRGVALYVGALLGPGLLLLPGLAAGLAGPASVLAWAGLLAVSALFALVFTRLGAQVPGDGGVIGYTAAGFGRQAGRAVGWCFLTAVVLGAPVVCLIGAGYVTALMGGGRAATALVAALLLAGVTALTLAGARVGSAVQLGLIALLLAVIVVGAAGALPRSRAANWTPFAPHGWAALGSAAQVLMLSFVGWEAVAPLNRRLADPVRNLPRITATAFAVTAAVYLTLSVTVIAVLGPHAAGPVPVADLLRVAVGSAGPPIAAACAVMLTLATVNSYLSGAAALAAHLSSTAEKQSARDAGGASDRRAAARGFFVFIAAAGLIELTLEAFGLLDTTRMVTIPTSLFLLVYVGCTASAARILPTRAVRIAAALGCAASAAILAFGGAAAVFALGVCAVALLGPRLLRGRPGRR